MRKRLIWLGFVPLFTLTTCPGGAQAEVTQGLYQIFSGNYIACCGIFGPLTQRLPTTNHAFVELTVDLSNKVAQMKFLGEDLRTVFRIPAQGPRSEFLYEFTNGVVLPGYIQFGEPSLPPRPDRALFSLVVTNSLDTLWINGVVFVPCDGCADVPQEFQHTNVVAVGMPSATIRVSEVEVCWPSVTNRNYQPQYRSELTPDTWVNLGLPVPGNGTTNCITDKVLPVEARRFYRVLPLP